MIKFNWNNAATLAMALTVAGFIGAPSARADKHDSNTLHKIGNAIQYPVRKTTENTSIATHRTEHRKSVESLRPQKATAVVIPNGKKFVVAHRGNMPGAYAHRRFRTETEERRAFYHHRRLHHHRHHRHS